MHRVSKSAIPGSASETVNLGDAKDQSPRWHRLLLVTSCIHSAVWGIFIMGWPELSARVYGFAAVPQEIHLWQGTGLFIVLLAVGYGVASTDSHRHCSAVLTGLLAKVFGAIGMCWAVNQGQVSSKVLWLLPLNDVIWWVPFALIVRDGFRKKSESSN